MKTSESIKTLMPDLVKAQTEMSSAKKGASNPFFKSKYADLPSIMEVCKEPLNSHGIVYLQPVVGNRVETILMHSSGEWIADEGTEIICAKQNDPQAYGSAITYAKRYGLQSMLGIPAEDDDAEGAMNRSKQVKQIPQEESYDDGVEQSDLCPIHGVLFKWGVSKKNGKKYQYHITEGNKYCFGEHA